MRTIPTEHRDQARRLARECWIDAKGDPALAERLFRERCNVNPAIFMLMLRIALALFQYWAAKKIAVPPAPK